MDIQTSKLEIMKMILELEDSALLEKVRKMISREKKDFYSNLSDDEKLEVRFGIEQLEKGDKTSWEEVLKKIS